jgi:single-stranded DNA-binding protein
MNKAFLSVQALEDPRQIYVDSSRTNVQLLVKVPAIAKKADTVLTLIIWSKAEQDRIMETIKKDSYLFVAGAKLRHDLDAREFSLQGGSVFPIRPNEFGIINEVILGGRCIKDIDGSDPKQFRATDSGYMICNQTLSVNTGKAQADLFNFYAINKADDRYNPAELLCNFTGKGTGLTICGRLVTDQWQDSDGNRRTTTKIQLNNMTLAPRQQHNEIKPQTTLSSDSAPASLWGQPQPEVPTSEYQQDTSVLNALREKKVPAVDELWGDAATAIGTKADDDAPF